MHSNYICSFSSCYYDKEETLYPGSACDSSTTTFGAIVLPIISSNCNSCHGGNTPSAGIALDTYAGVKTQVDNGKLWGAISQSAAYSPMPKNGTKLSACNLAKIKKWIDAGAPNN
ncbi:MAG: hypothetical protein IPP48_05835 [Chitinophagaceae bacterium]|nr:hypothetical protein [Chitinophagaceae bacterium]